MTQQILVLEDDIAVRTYTCKVLQAAGYQTLEADNGELAIETIQSCCPDLLVSDLMLPGRLNGYGVLAEIRNQPTIAQLPVIFLTCKDRQPDIRKGIELGADDYLTKPVDRLALLAAIAARLASPVHVSKSGSHFPPASGEQGSIQWMMRHAIEPQLAERYSGWYVAFDPGTKHCFLGATQDEAWANARRVNPEGIFFMTHLCEDGRTSAHTQPLTGSGL